MKPYIIVAPHFSHNSAGIRALHSLCHRLNEKGFPAYSTGGIPWRIEGFSSEQHISSIPREQLKEIQREGIVVYPDITPGNPLRFNNVVKWWLGITYESPTYMETFSYAPNHNVQHQADHNLCIWYMEKCFTLPEEGAPRPNTCFRVHKGAHLPRIPETAPPCIEIAGGHSRQALATLLQTSSIFYSYDDLSTISIEARLCGCPVKVIGYTCVDKEHFVTGPFSNYAQAIPGEPINLPKLKSEIPLFLENYREMERISEKELDKFIDITQDMKRDYVEDIRPIPPQTWLPIELFTR